jgi:hypothetical protein
MRVEIACITLRAGLVYGKIYGHLVTLGDLPGEGSRQRHPLGCTQLGWESYLIFARHPGVVAFLHVFHGIPQPLAIARPSGFTGIKLAGQKDLSMQNIAAAAVLAVALRVHLETLLQALLEGEVCTREEVRDFVKELERDALQYDED